MDLKGIINPKMLNYKLNKKTSVAITATSYKEPPLVVYTQTNGTNMPPKSTKNTMENATQETLKQLKLVKSQTMIYSVLDSLVRALALREKGEDLRTPEGLSFLKSLGLQSTKDPNIYCLKTSRVCLVTTAGKLSRQCLGFSPTWGIELNGRYLTAKTLEFPKRGNECSLSDILEEKVDKKYFLSEKAMKGMFHREKSPLVFNQVIKKE